MNLSLETMSPTKVYHLLTQTVVPRPIAWVLTRNENGSQNVAPFSYFTPVASTPPLLMISIGKKSTGDDKDTVVNLQREQFCTVHIASVEQMTVLNASSAELDLNESEVDLLGLSICNFDEALDSQEVKRIAGTPIAFSCKLHQVQQIVEGIQTLVFLEVLEVFIDDAVIDAEKKRLTISSSLLNPLTRLGAGEFAELGQVIPLLRPK